MRQFRNLPSTVQFLEKTRRYLILVSQLAGLAVDRVASHSRDLQVLLDKQTPSLSISAFLPLSDLYEATSGLQQVLLPRLEYGLNVNTSCDASFLCLGFPLSPRTSSRDTGVFREG